VRSGLWPWPDLYGLRKWAAGITSPPAATNVKRFSATTLLDWANDTVSYSYAKVLRSSLSLLAPNASSWTQSYGYDGGNRLNSLSSPAGMFTYAYKGPGNLVTNLA
jgi:hypothetical protein